MSEALLDHEADIEGTTSLNSVSSFIAVARQPQLQRAAHMCRYGDQLLVVVANHDQGKSFFLDKLVDELKGSTQLALVKSRSLESPAELLSQILSLFVDQLPDNQDMSIGALLARIRVCLTQDSLTAPVVLIDDANWLTDEVLSMLLSLLSAGFESAPLKIVMAGNRELVARLDRLGGLEAMIYDLELALPTLDDWHQFAESALDLDINRASTKAIVDGGRGEFSRVLDELNQIDDPFAEPMLDTARAQPRLGLSPVHMIAIVSLLAVGVGMFLIGDRLGSGSSPVEQSKPPAIVVLDSSQPKTAVLETPSATDNSPSGSELNDVERDLSGSAVSAQELREEVVGRGELLQNNAVAEVVVDQPRGEADAGESGDDRLIVSDSVAESVVAKSTITNSSNNGTVGKIQTQPALKTPVSQKLTGSIPVLSRPDNHYVLQIMAAQGKESLETFLKSQRNRDSIELVTLKRNGQDWFVLLQGDYENRQQARDSIASLPENQQKNGAWPRSISEIKANFRGN